MKKKLKQNGLVEGSMIAYISVIITKILGALYVIPFYAIIGKGSFIYASAYKLYDLVMNVSTSGIPTSISILVAEYNTKGMQRTKRKIYIVGSMVVFGISLILFLILQIFATPIAGFFMAETQPTDVINTGTIGSAIRAMSFCLLFAPFLSMKRGYLQGHSYIAHSSYSQVVEQVVRIAVVLAGSFIAIKVLGLSEAIGANIAIAGAGVAAAVSLLYLQLATAHRLVERRDKTVREKVPDAKTIIKKILKYSIPVVIVAASTNIYEIVDYRLVMDGMGMLGTPDADVTAIAEIIGTWAPKICMLIYALSMGLTASLVPNMTSSFVKRKFGEVNKKFVLAINTITVAAVPIAVGLAMLSTPVYTLFYGQSKFGPIILQWLCFISVISSVKNVVGMALQSMGRAKLVCGCTILGLVINAGLDLPLIFLFNALGLPAYLGTALSTVIGVSVNLIIAFVSLKRQMNFKYIIMWQTLVRAILPNAAMALVVWLMSLVIPMPQERGIVMILVLCLFALVGGAVYFLIAYKLHLIQQVFGDDIINKVLIKLHIKRA